MRGGPKAEVEIVATRLERIRELDVVQWPTTGDIEIPPTVAIYFDVVHAIRHPDAHIPLRVSPHPIGEDVAAVYVLLGEPLQPGEAANGGVDAAEPLRVEPSQREGADAAGGLPSCPARVGIRPKLHGLFDLPQDVLVQVVAIAVRDCIVLQAAHGVALFFTGKARRTVFAAGTWPISRCTIGGIRFWWTRLSVTVCSRKLIRSRDPKQFCPSCQIIRGAPRTVSMPAFA